MSMEIGEFEKLGMLGDIVFEVECSVCHQLHRKKNDFCVCQACVKLIGAELRSVPDNLPRRTPEEIADTRRYMEMMEMPISVEDFEKKTEEELTVRKRTSETRDKVLGFLEATKKAVTAVEIGKNLGLKASAARKACLKLSDEGKAIVKGSYILASVHVKKDK